MDMRDRAHRCHHHGFDRSFDTGRGKATGKESRRQQLGSEIGVGIGAGERSNLDEDDVSVRSLLTPSSYLSSFLPRSSLLDPSSPMCSCTRCCSVFPPSSFFLLAPPFTMARPLPIGLETVVGSLCDLFMRCVMHEIYILLQIQEVMQ
jgi:hypothetical protein